MSGEIDRRFALDPLRLTETTRKLEARISARFAGSGLSRAAAQLSLIAAQAADRTVSIERPVIGIRLLVAALLVSAAVVGVAVLALLVQFVQQRGGVDDVSGLLQGIDASFNIAILIGAALFFVVTLESRIKRGRALADIHEMRALVHVIDMHQLTKDPSATFLSGPATPASPERTLTPFELMRYLDYCSEMLSLCGKIAALYGHSSRDAVVIATVNELEHLAATMSQKIWQKIALVVESTKDRTRCHPGA